MNPVHAIGAALVSLAIPLAACGDAEEKGEASDDSKLIGGTTVALSDLPATLHLEGACTAAKVAPRLILTAAHCVLDMSTLAPRFGPDRPVKLSREPTSEHAEHAVAKVHVHPTWMRKCRDTLCSISAVTLKLDAPDVAIIELAEDLADVPAASIAPKPLEPGDEVILVGYGCTKGVHQPDERAAPSLAAAEDRVIPASRAVHDGSPLATTDEPVYGGNYVLTPGPGDGSARAGLCPGDSGGPLYARRDGKLVVVGINANYTLRPDAKDALGLPVTNWHTRLDTASRNKVYEWTQAIARGEAPGL